MTCTIPATLASWAIEKIYPHPISERAIVEYRLPEPQLITIELFNVLRQRIWVERQGQEMWRTSAVRVEQGVCHVRTVTLEIAI